MRRVLTASTLILVFAMIITACAPAPTPQVIEKIVEKVVTKEVEKVVQQTVVVQKEVEKKVEVTKIVEKIVEKEVKLLPLFWDGAANKCAKKVVLTVATHGDHFSRNQDALFGVGVLMNE